MSHKAINFREKFGRFTEQWVPKVIAEMNDYQFKVVKLQSQRGRCSWSRRRSSTSRTRRGRSSSS